MIWIYIWLGVVVLSLIVEFVTMELVSIWITAGSLIAMILAACGVSYEIQIIVAVAVSIACIIGLRKITLKFLNKNETKTNADSLIGTKAKLITSITADEMGTVKYNGIIWNCTTQDGSEIEKDCHIEILKIEGNKLIVKKSD
ncbi:MAG: NfeD family protein [Christensenellales bacterium]